MKQFINKYRNYIFFFIVLVVFAGTQSPRLRFGNVILQDTLNGGIAPVTGRIYAWDSASIGGVNIQNGQIKAPNGIGFADPNLISIDDNGFDLKYILPNNGTHSFMSGATEVMVVDSNKITFNKPVNFGSNAIGGYREYVATISQTSTNAPILTSLSNTTGLSAPVSSYEDAGVYNLTFSSGILTANKTLVILGTELTDNTGALQITNAERSSNTVITLTTGLWSHLLATQTDGILTNTPLIIRIYN